MPKGIYKRKIGIRYGMSGKHHTQETKTKISINNKGKPSPMGMLGKKHSEESKRKISIALKEFTKNSEVRKKMSERVKGDKNPRGMLGKHHTKEIRESISKNSKGKILLEKTKKKISIANKGKKLTNETKEKIRKKVLEIFKNGMPKEIKAKIKENAKINPNFGFKGRKHSEETCKKISKSRKGKYCGEKNNFWKGGISFEPYGIEFNNQLREQIRQRDNYRCQQCFKHQNELFRNTKVGLRKYKLMIHHIDFNKQNNNPNNLISLCNKCHLQTNYKREDWVEYFKKKIHNLGGD